MRAKVQSIVYIGISFLTAIFLLISFNAATMYFDGQSMSYSNILLTVGEFIVISVLIFFLFKAVNKAEGKLIKILTVSLFGLFIVGELVFLFAFSSIPSADAYNCIDTAVGFLNDKNLIVDENHRYYNYFCHYSNNNLFIMILYLYFKIFRISNYVFASKVLNAVLIFVAVVFAYLSVKLLFGEKTALKAMVIFVLNPSLYFHIQWVYTLTFSLPFMMAIFYIGLLIPRQKSIIKIAALSAIIAVLSAIGYLIRPTSIFPLIAFAIILLMRIKLNKEYWKRFFSCVASFTLVFFIVFQSCLAYANHRFEKTIPYNLPITHWIMMGLSNDGSYDSGEVSKTNSFGDTKQEKIDGNVDEIKKRVEEKGFSQIDNHLVKKLGNTFLDGTHATLHRMRQQESYSALSDVVVGDNNFWFVLYCQGFRLFTFAFCLVGIYYLVKKDEWGLMPFVITVLGGFVFYLLWETKQAYSLPFTLPMLTIGIYGLSNLDSRIKLFKKSKLNILSAFIAITLFISYAFIALGYNEKFYVYSGYDYSVKSTSNYISEPLYLKDSSSEITQQFYTDNAFNYIRIYAKVSKTKSFSCKFSIADENGKNIITQDITQDAFKRKSDGTSVFSMKLDEISGSQKYIINITGFSGDSKVGILKKHSFGVDNYKGDLYYNGQKQYGDLLLEVGEYEQPIEQKK